MLGKPIPLGVYSPLILQTMYKLDSLVPRLPDLFQRTREKRGGAWDPMSRDKRRQNGIAPGLPQSIDFKPAWHLLLIERSSARSLRIVLPSRIVTVAFFFTQTEPERMKIMLAHAHFQSRSATLPTLAYRPTSRT